MEQQRILRKQFTDSLIEGVKSGELIHLFRNSEFPIDDKNTLIMPHIEKPLGLLNKMKTDKNSDFYSAIVLYEAFQKLTPLEAADPRLWNYLSIVDLYPYQIERWPDVYRRKEKTNEVSYILEHFLIEDNSQKLLRNGLAGLWWSVHLSIDESNIENRYHLTEVLFWNQTLRTRTMGNGLFARKKELALGFLDYCNLRGRDNFGSFEKEHQELTLFLNNIGGAKMIAIFNREEIKNLLLNRFPLTKPISII